MRVSERRRLILEAVQQHGVISMREAAALVGTSEVTARRDLRHLAEEGLIRRTHGGAAAPNIVSREAPFLEKAQLAAAEKDAIAVVAAEMVDDGDAIAFGPGTTTLSLARRLTTPRRAHRRDQLDPGLPGAAGGAGHPPAALRRPGPQRHPRPRRTGRRAVPRRAVRDHAVPVRQRPDRGPGPVDARRAHRRRRPPARRLSRRGSWSSPTTPRSASRPCRSRCLSTRSTS